MPKKSQINQKINEAQVVLKALGLPPAQQNDMAALTLLALSDLRPSSSWQDAQKPSLTVSKGVMDFISQEYKREYAPNTRETVRRQVLHQFVQAYVAHYNPDDPTLPTNSPRAHYALTDDALAVIKSYGTSGWELMLKKFESQHGKLVETYRKRRKRNMVPITIDGGETLELSPGKHNEVQAAVVEEFAPRFAPGSKLLYLGDTAKKNLYVNEEVLEKLGIPITEHDKLPDIVLFDENKRWLYLIEVVTSHGPMSPKRMVELEEMLQKCSVGKVYVTAFPDFSEFRKHTSHIAWETEVWLAEIPDHMIHYNGDRFYGPR
ncbi:restriction endonuclease [Candidatus Woesebacteria bacterium]|nr:restriction endonuclease [Candidatus Woesebacteria bacterium]